jgi:hypothetical protein
MKTKTNDKKRGLVFGDFIVAAYNACGTRGAKEFIRLAVNGQLVRFRGQQRFLISEA